MCLAIPGQIVQMLPHGDLATATVSGVKRNINIGLLGNEGIRPGDWVLIHVGFAISKIDEEEARSSLEFLRTLGQAYANEIQALCQSSEAATSPEPEGNV